MSTNGSIREDLYDRAVEEGIPAEQVEAWVQEKYEEACERAEAAVEGWKETHDEEGNLLE